MFTLRKSSQKNTLSFRYFPNWEEPSCPNWFWHFFWGAKNKMKKSCPNCAQTGSQGGGNLVVLPKRKEVFFWEVNPLIYAMNAHAHAWCLFTVAPFFRLFVFMNFCNCTTYCKVRIRISGFLTGGRSQGFLYSRRFLGLAIKCLLHCIDWAAVEMCQR